MRRGSMRPGGDQLGRFEDVDGREIAIFGFAFVDVSEGGVGGAEIDADFHVGNCSMREREGGEGARARSHPFDCTACCRIITT